MAMNIQKKVEEKKQPEARIKAGGIVATIWKNELTNGGTTYSVSMKKNYYDNTTKSWKDTTSLNTNDLPKAVVVLQQAYEWILCPEETEDNDSDNGKEAEEEAV